MTSAPQAPPRSPRRDLRAQRERSPWPYRRRFWFAAAAALAVHAGLWLFSGKALLTGVEFGMGEPPPTVDIELVEQAAPTPEPPAPPPPPMPEPPKPEPVPEPPKPDDMVPPKPEPPSAPKPVTQPVPPKPRSNPKPVAASRPQTAASAVTRSSGSPGTASSGRATTPAHLYNPKPEYPPESRAAGEEGVAVFRVLVGINGRPASVTLARSSGHPRLDRAAQEAVRRWRFKPATRDGQPVSATVDVPVRFSLQ